MDRRTFLCGLTVGTVAAPIVAEGQQTGKVWRVGYLGNFSGSQETTEAFRQGLRELGSVEGQNIAIEWRPVWRKPEQLPDLTKGGRV